MTERAEMSVDLAEQDDDNSPEIPSTSSTWWVRSAILDGGYFKIVKQTELGQVQAECKLCTKQKNIISGSLAAMTNFKVHLKSIHPEALQDYEQHKQDFTASAAKKKTPANTKYKQSKLFAGCSRRMADVCKLLKVQQLRTTVYHPQTDGLVERFNQTLKQMLCRVAAKDKRDWDQMLPYVLSGVREIPQGSTGFTPFELHFGRQPRGLLDVAREAWEQQPAVHRTTVEHVREMRERIDRVMPIVREHLVKAQQAQQRHYNWAAQPWEFQRGDHVLVLVPTTACKFLATWQGPYTVTEKVGPVTYHVRQPGRRREDQLYHINLLKCWVGTGPQLSAYTSSTPVVVDMDPQLSAAQKSELQHLVSQFPDVFSPQPGRTHVVEHDVRTPPGTIVRQWPYRVPEAQRHAVEEEVQEMLRLGVIEPSCSPWSSPIVMVPKPDGTLRFCNNFCRLNEVSEFDCYPMPRVNELLDRLGRAQFISTLDLTKGYWQVPLTDQAKLKTAFSTPSGHWQYRVLPFGLHGAPATFQRLMDVLLRPHQAYAAAYLDDVVIHSETWEDHLERLYHGLSGHTCAPSAAALINPANGHRGERFLRKTRLTLSFPLPAESSV
uniref:ribonuclease H n=1 Tax=Cyprinus carpio TaxID=7962 RepID=A0A8C2C586_CYPCA